MNRFFSIFDIDHTLVLGNCSRHFGFFLYRKGVVSHLAFFRSVFYYILHKLSLISLPTLHQQVFTASFLDTSAADLRCCAELFVKERGEALYHPTLLHRLRQAQDRGDFVGILSSSPDVLIAPIAKALGVKYWHATHYQEAPTGEFSALGSIVDGKEKKRLLTQWLKVHGGSTEHTIAYTDSEEDLPLLQSVAFPVVVSPKKNLYQLALHYGWEVIE